MWAIISVIVRIVVHETVSLRDRPVVVSVVLFGLRALTYQLWSSFSNMLFATRRRRVVRDGVDFEQIDREWDWYVRPRKGIPIRSLQR